MTLPDEEQTLTPGIFFHGSPQCDLEQFTSQFDETGEGRRGVYFTHLPDHAMVYAFGRNREWLDGKVGRVYMVELVTQSEFAVSQAFREEYWEKEGYAEGNGAEELMLEQAAIAKQRDCIVSGESHGHITEVIVVNPSVIRCQTKMGAPIAEAARAIKTGIFYSVGDAPVHQFGSEYPLFFSSRRRAHAVGGTVRQVVIETGVSFYCDSDAWPMFDLDALRSDLRIDCLVDPVTGDALSLGTTELKPLNRTERRVYLKLKKKRSR